MELLGGKICCGRQLSVTPHHTVSSGLIRLSGKVAGPIPRAGTVVELLVHHRARWEPSRDPRTNAGGRFSVPYQLEGGVGRFPFRAEVLGGQSGFPYATGQSAAIPVATR